jgi:hypothetical protein
LSWVFVQPKSLMWGRAGRRDRNDRFCLPKIDLFKPSPRLHHTPSTSQIHAQG